MVGQPEVSLFLAGGVVVFVNAVVFVFVVVFVFEVVVVFVFVFVFVVVVVVVVGWSTCSANLWVVSVTAPRQPPSHQAHIMPKTCWRNRP